MKPSKITLPKDSELPKHVADRLNSLPPINVYRMLANAPQVLIPWTDMVKELYNSKVDIRLREIAILRQGSRAQAEYELHQHKFVASSNGITDEEINIICNSDKVTQLSELENCICQMADEIETTATLKDETLYLLQKHLDTQELTEIIVLTSFYSCVARVLNATRTEIEKEPVLKGSDNPN